MRHRTKLVCALSLWMASSSTSAAQTPPEASGQQPPVQGASSKATEHSGIINGLPSWLRLGVELRARAEFNLDPDRDREDRLYLNRLRLNATVEPARWMRLTFEGQDARAIGLNRCFCLDGQRDTLDGREGYLELGQSEEGWRVRLGRQELSVGDERLVGADNYWDAFGQAFDAVRLSFVRQRFRAEAFSGFRVEPARRRPDLLDKTSRISGISAQ